MHKYELGVKARCQLTGFKGIIMARNEWVNGCRQYLVKPKVDKDGKMKEGEWIDEEQLELLSGKGINIATKPTGGPQKDTRQRSHSS